MSRPSVAIVSPALAAANNGNWQTARRWQEFIASQYDARIIRQWPDDLAREDSLMLALHARRSAASIEAWTRSRGNRGLAVVLTGTDLYADIATHEEARRSLQLANCLVVLQELGAAALPDDVRGKARVIYQSTSALPPVAKSANHLHAVMVGHLREVKSPQTLFAAARLLKPRADISIGHIGDAPEAQWAALASETMAECPNYRWLGPLPHGDARRAIQEAHVLVHTSALEGGAHVIMEAVCSGTPVIASHVPGNIGMLGPGYEGYFPHGDAPSLAALLARCRDSQSGDDPAASLLASLRSQCDLRAALFEPEAERAALFQLLKELQDPR